MIKKKEIIQKFRSRFSGEPIVVRSPGRINLIGEHTDYNEGFVLPAPIDKEIIFAIGKNQKNSCRIFSHDMDDYFECSLVELSVSDKGWPDYILGVVDQLQQRGMEVSGFDLVFGGNIPFGAGLSSSAAVECGIAFGLNELFYLNIPAMEMVKLAQKAENEFVGMQCGIMDQFASIFGKADHVIQLDCRSLEYEYYPLDLGDYTLVLCDSRVKHSLVSSEYNDRRAECEQGVSVLKQYDPAITSLRDVSLDFLEKHKNALGTNIYKRCKYVVEENQRVLEVCEHLKNHNIAAAGHLMYQTHQGLSAEYEVSCKEMDLLVDLTRDYDAVLGSRMMGGGFGGCTINMVKISELHNFNQYITAAYKSETGITPYIYSTKIVNGTSLCNGLDS